MSAGLKAAAGSKMREALARLSGNRLIGCLTGCAVTMVLSSSSAASVIVITFVESGLLSFQQCLGVLLGVNIVRAAPSPTAAAARELTAPPGAQGTTMTGHLVAIKLTKYAWHMVAAGFFAVFFSKDQATKQKAEIAHGLGLLFVGMEAMGSSMEPLQTRAQSRPLCPARPSPDAGRCRADEPFRELLATMEDVPLGIGAACAFTVLIQSSSAATGVIITVSQQGMLTAKAGLALILGANIGTCGTACLAAIGKKKETLQVAAAYLFFKLLGVALALTALDTFTDGVIDHTMGAEQASALRAAGTDSAALSDTVPQFLANSHTVFNILLAVLCLPFTPQIAALVEQAVSALDAADAGTVPKKTRRRSRASRSPSKSR